MRPKLRVSESEATSVDEIPVENFREVDIERHLFVKSWVSYLLLLVFLHISKENRPPTRVQVENCKF